MSPTHPTAEAGFGSAAERYERGRPSYPPDAVAMLADQLDIRAGRRVLDLAAGTGKLTRLLQPLGAELAALEPVAEMRRVPWYESWTWQPPEGLFSRLERSSFPHAQRVDAERLIDRVLSTSYIAVLDAESRSELRADVLGLVAEFGDGEFDLPYRTDLFCCRRT